MRAFTVLKHVTVWLCGAILIAMSVAISVEVVLRKLFTLSLGGVDELSGYGFAIFTGFAFSYAALRNANIRIELFYYAVPAWARVILDLLAQLSLIGFVGLFAWGALGLTWDSLIHARKAITPLATPLAYPQAAWTLGVVLLFLTLVAVLLLAIRALARGDRARFFALLGPATEMQAADEELGRARREAQTHSNAEGS